MVRGLRRGGNRSFSLRLISYNGVAARTRRLRDLLGYRYSTDLVSHRNLLGRNRPCMVIVGAWTNLSEFLQDRPLNSLSAVTWITEGLLQNYFDGLFGAGDPFDDLAG